MDTRPFPRRAQGLALALATLAGLALPESCAPMRNPPRAATFDAWILPKPADVRHEVAARAPAPDDDPVLEFLLRSFAEFEPARRFVGAVDFREEDPAVRAREGRIDRSRQIPPPAGGGGDALLSLFAMAAQGWTAHNQAPR